MLLMCKLLGESIFDCCLKISVLKGSQKETSNLLFSHFAPIIEEFYTYCVHGHLTFEKSHEEMVKAFNYYTTLRH